MEKQDTDINENKGFQSRGDAMDAILAQRQEELKEEVGELLEEEETDTEDADSDEADSDEAEDNEDEEDEGEPSDGKGDDGEDDQEQNVDLIVDGEKKTMKMSEVLRVAQKNLAADQRLADAEAKRKEAEAYLKTAKSEKQEDDTDATDNDNDDIDKVIAEKRSAYLHAMNYGEPEEQEQAMIEYERAVRGVSSQKITDTRELAATIKAEIKEELTGDQIRQRFNLPESQGGYGDIMADPDLRDLCFAKIDKAINEDGKDHTDWNTYADVSQSIRKKFLTKDKKPSASNALEEKKTRKRKIDNLDTISDSKSSDAKELNPQSSKGLRQDVLADMAKTRPGQSNY